MAELELQEIDRQLGAMSPEEKQGTSSEYVSLVKRKSDAMDRLAELQETRRIQDVKQQAANRDGVTQQIVPPGVDDYCSKCHEPIVPPKQWDDDSNYVMRECCGKCLCRSCVHAMVTTTTNATRRGEAVASTCPCCPAPFFQTPTESFQSLMTLANNGNTKAQAMIGERYAKGQTEDGVVDFAKAYKWTQRAADKGNAACQFGMAEVYHLGIPAAAGIKKSPTKAREYCTASAKLGDARGQSLLGIIRYEEKSNNGKEDPQVLQWFTLSADQGYAHAQQNLSALFEQGHCGAEISLTKSLYWLTRAARGGNRTALSQLPFLKLRVAQEIMLIITQ